MTHLETLGTCYSVDDCLVCLPAMAAPTPLSALVHLSTLVTVGFYLLIHFSPSFGCQLSVILLLVSGLTLFIAGLGVNCDCDLKKTIALSTLKQLGLPMTISIGLSGLAFFPSINPCIV